MKGFVTLMVLSLMLCGIWGCDRAVPPGASAKIDGACVQQRHVGTAETHRAEAGCPAELYSLLD